MEAREDPLSPAPQSWVQFENEEAPSKEAADSPAALPPPPSRNSITTANKDQSTSGGPAIIDSRSVQVSVDNSSEQPSGASISHSATNGTSMIQTISNPLNASQLHDTPTSSPLQTVPLGDTNDTQTRSSIRQGFANGDVIVTLLPQNTSMAWLTPAHFRPELVPEELMAQGLTLTVEDYVHVMTQLVNDNRFKLFNICYKRIVMAWIAVGFIILLTILFSSSGRQLELFGAGIAWLLLNAAAIFLCMYIKIRLNRGLERCMAGINLQLLKHKILLGLDDRGKLSCHKVNLCFIYFDASDCLAKLEQLIDEDARAVASADGGEGARPSLQARLDIDDPDIIIAGATNTRISKQKDKTQLLFAKYSQRWAKDFLRKRLDWSFDALARAEGLAPPTPPRHLISAHCPCQYIEKHLGLKDLQKQKEMESQAKGCCGTIRNFFKEAHSL